MRPRRLLLFAFVALLGAVAAVPQAFAAPSTLKLEVAQNCHIGNWPCWNPKGNPEASVPENEVPPLKLAQGGTITFEDKDAQAPTDVIWKVFPSKPGCTGVFEAPPTKTGWSGTCTFSQPGIYKFESEGLFKETYYAHIDYTKYEIVVIGTPTDTTTSASGEAQTEATLNGSINPQGNTVQYQFEYEGPGVTGKPLTPIATLTAADFTSDPVSAQATGLEPGMTYKFKLVATYEAGTKTVAGATTQTFTTHAVTAPTATTLAAEGIKETEATLKGTVNPGGEATEYFFEYGTDTHYGQKTEKATLQTSGGSNQSVFAKLKGLTGGTEYHFRLVSKNKQGLSEGLDHSFKTTSPPAKEPTKEPPAKEPTPKPTPTPTPGPISPEPEIAPLVPPLVEGSLKLTAPRHGSSVRGSIGIGLSGRLEVDLLAKPSALGARGSKPVVVGRLVRASVSAGKVSFSVSLTARAKSALRRHRRLAITVKITLTPTRGAVVVTRGIVLRA